VYCTLVTGSNRGLGLAWVRQFAREGWRVYATCRQPEQADELQALAEKNPAVSIHQLDVTQPEQIHGLARELGGQPIDILVNNAGVYFEKFKQEQLDTIDYGAWQATFEVNTLGAVRVTEGFIGNVARSERHLVVAISSDMGSISRIESGGSYAYRSSKAALNAAMKGVALELRPQGIGVLLLHPGWVRTRMGGPDASLLPAESVAGMRKIIEHFTPVDSGSFFRYDGEQLPW
jgi:NAD(P)-dependent dehydrogenase (short-subunit alcohol dehydrogenase family)